MTIYVAPDIISFLLLCFVFIVLWRQRRQFHSLLPFSAAVLFLSIGRISDIIVDISIAALQWNQGHVNFLLTSGGNISDAAGTLCLIYGFLKTIEHQRHERQHIEELEHLLPLCAWCKKYRTGVGEWKPIEQYLHESGAEMTHGICPECAAKMKSGTL